MNFDSLSQEIILRHILVNPSLSIVDICNVSQTCSFLDEIIKKENSLWKQKFCQRWPKLSDSVKHDSKNWLQRVQSQVNIENEIKASINTMTKECCSVKQPTLESMAVLSMTEPYVCVEQAILKIAYNKKTYQSSSLTEVYYAKYLLRYLRCQQADTYIKDYVSQEKKDLLKGAFLVSKWGSVTNEILPQWWEVSQMLDDINSHIMINLKKKKGKQEPRNKVNVIIHTFFNDMNFKCDTVEDFEKTDWEQLKNAYYIFEVLRTRTGKPILMAMIFEELLKQFDVSSEIISHENCIYLRIRLNKMNAEYVYVDLVNHSLLRNPTSLADIPASEDPIFNGIINPLYIIAKHHVHAHVLKNINRQQLVHFELNFSRLMCSWKPHDSELHVRYAMSCMTYDMHIYEARHLITKTHESNPFVFSIGLSLDQRIRNKKSKLLEPIIPKVRDEIFIEYAVGMTIFLDREADGHGLINGVITDWDYFCARENMWPENIVRFDLQRPFYTIIKEDGSKIYIPEDKIVGVNLHPIQMTEDIIGAHFHHFNGYYYEGNLTKRKHYPEDEGFNYHFFFVLNDPDV